MSATVRSETALAITTNWQVPNTTIARLSGSRALARSSCCNSEINLIDSEHRVFADNRRTQVDVRFAKVFKFGRTKTDIGVDLWNLFNTNYPTTYQGTYTTVAGQPLGGTWGQPSAIYPPRFVRLNFTVNY